MKIRSSNITNVSLLIRPRQIGAKNKRINIHHHVIDGIIAIRGKRHPTAKHQTASTGNIEISRCYKLAISTHFTAVKRKIRILCRSEIPQNTIVSERQNRTIRKYAAVFHETLIAVVFEKHLTARYFHIHKGGICKNRTDTAWRNRSKIAATHPEAPFNNPEIRFENSTADIDISKILIFPPVVPIILHVNTPASISQFKNLTAIQN